MKKLLFCMTCLIAMASCSSSDLDKEDTNTPINGPLKVSNVLKSECKISLSEKETIPEVYSDYMAKSPVLSIKLEKDGTANCKLTDVLENCAVENINVKAIGKDRDVVLVYYPVGDPELQADCMCAYDVDFKINKLTSGKYRLTVYHADYSADFSTLTPFYEGQVDLENDKTMTATLKTNDR